MTSVDRRAFLRRGAVGAGGLSAFGGLGLLSERAAAAKQKGSTKKSLVAPDNGGYGPLQPDPAGVLALPAGFSYVRFGETGEPMSDGMPTPGGHDGMAAFPGEGSTVRLVRTTSGAPAPCSVPRPTTRRPRAVRRTWSTTPPRRSSSPATRASPARSATAPAARRRHQAVPQRSGLVSPGGLHGRLLRGCPRPRIGRSSVTSRSAAPERALGLASEVERAREASRLRRTDGGQRGGRRR